MQMSCGCGDGSTYTLGTNTTATVTIEDNDQWDINVTAIDATGSEANTGETADPVKFRFTRSGETDLSKAVTVYYAFGGTATRGSDYQSPSGYGNYYDSTIGYYGSITISVNQTYADLTLNIINDSIAESTETITATVLDGDTSGCGSGCSCGCGGTPNRYYHLGTNTTPTASLLDNDSVSSAPASPTGLAATVVSQTKIDLNWNASTGATSYTLQRSANGTSGWSTVYTGSNTSYSNTSLSANTTYYYRVCATNSIGSSANSANASGKTLPNAPTSPSTLSGTVVSQTQINLSWSAVTGATNYVLERSASGTSGWSTIFSGSSTSFSHTGLNAATTYYYRVTASNSGGSSTASSSISRTTLVEAPSTPTALNVVTVSTSRIDVAWAASNGATGYTLQRSTTGTSSWSTVYTGSNTSYSNTGLTVNRTYYYRVLASNAGGSSAYTSIAGASTNTSTLTIPVGLTATAASSTRIDLQWGSSNSATGYVLERSLNGSSGWTVIYSGTNTNYKNIGLDESTRYYYRVKAENTTTTSSYSTTANATTSTKAPPSPSGLVASSMSQTRIDLSWNSVAGATSYVLERAEPETMEWTPIYSGANTSYSNTNLTVDTTYYYRVKAVKSTASSGYSSMSIATTGQNVPGTPGTPTAAAVSPSKIKLTWNSVTNATSYVLEQRKGTQGEWQIVYSGSQRECESISLERNTTYYYRLQAVGLYGSSGYSSTISKATLSSVVNSDPPRITGLSLLVDTGEDEESYDGITYNPTIKGGVAGNFSNEILRVEFDHTGNGTPNGSVVLTTADDVLMYDPRRFDMSFVQPSGTNTSSVTLKYRTVRLDFDGNEISTSSWSTFSYTLSAAPTSTSTPSGLSATQGVSGEWTNDGSVAIKGTATGASFAQIVRSNDSTNSVIAGVEPDGTFCGILPKGIDYGTAATFNVRVFTYSETEKMYLAGLWQTVAVTPAAPVVSALALKNDTGTSSSDGISSDITLTGQVTAAVGKAYATVEFWCGTTKLGSTTTDDEGKFTFVPNDLPMTSGYKQGTVVAKVLAHKLNGTTIYGTSRSTFVKYVPETAPVIDTLVSTKPGSPTSSNEVNAAVTVEEGVDHRIAFSYKIGSGAWSDYVIQGTSTVADSDTVVTSLIDNGDEEPAEVKTTFWQNESTFFVPGLFAMSGSTQTIQVRAKSMIWDPILEDYVEGAVNSCTINWTKPTYPISTISDLKVANVTHASQNLTTDPTISGTVVLPENDVLENPGGIKVEILSGTTVIGTTYTAEDGSFSFTPTGLTNGSKTLSVRTLQWNPYTQTNVNGTSSSVTFTYSKTYQPAPSVTEFKLLDATGVNSNASAHLTLTGRIVDDGGETSRLLVEFDHTGNGVVDGSSTTSFDGTFLYTPTGLTTGSKTIRARAARYDVSTSTWIRGSWTSYTMTVQAVASNWKPQITEVESHFSYGSNAAGIAMTEDPAFSGSVSSQKGFANVSVQIDVGANGTVDDTVSVDNYGKFAYRPELTLPSSGELSVTVKTRALYTDPATQAVTYGDWNTYTYLYRNEMIVRGTTLLGEDCTVTQGSSGDTYLVSGSILPGPLAHSTWVEIDYGGDGNADVRVLPQGTEFAFECAPEKSTIRLRAVEVRSDGTVTYPTEQWTTFAVSNYSNGALHQAYKDDPYRWGDMEITTSSAVRFTNNPAVTLKLDLSSIGAFSSDNDEIQYDNITFNLGAGQALSHNTFKTLLESHNDLDDGDLEYEPRLYQVYGSYLNADGETVYLTIPIVNLEDASSLQAEQMLQELDDKVDQHNTISGYFADSQVIPFQESLVPAGPMIVTFSAPTQQQQSSGITNSGVSHVDRERLNNIDVPQISSPILDGGFPDIASDNVLREAINTIQKNYTQAVNALTTRFTPLWDEAIDGFLSDLKTQTATQQQKIKELREKYEKLGKESFESTARYREIQEQRSDAIKAAEESRQAAITAATEVYNVAAAPVTAAYNAAAAAINAQYSGYPRLIALSNAFLTYSNNLRPLQKIRTEAHSTAWADYTKAVSQAQKSYNTSMATAKDAFDRDIRNQLYALAEEVAKYAKQYDEIYYNLLTGLYTNEGGLNDILCDYQEELQGIYQTYSAQADQASTAAFNRWKNSSTDDQAWIDHIAALYGIVTTAQENIDTAAETASNGLNAKDRQAMNAVSTATFTAALKQANATRAKEKTMRAAEKKLLNDAATAKLAQTVANAERANNANIDAANEWESEKKTLISASYAAEASIAALDNTHAVACYSLDQEYYQTQCNSGCGCGCGCGSGCSGTPTMTYVEYLARLNNLQIERDAGFIPVNRTYYASSIGAEATYREAMQTKAVGFNKACIDQNKTYEDALVDAMKAYWISEADAIAVYSKEMVSVAFVYATDVSATGMSWETAYFNAQTGLDSTVNSASSALLTSSTQENSGFYDGQISGYLDNYDADFENKTGADADYLKGGSTNTSSYIDAIFGAESTLAGIINGVVSTVIDYSGLGGAILGGASNVTTLYNNAIKAMEETRIETVKERSVKEINARASYYKAVNTADADKAKTAVDISAQEFSMLLKYGKTAASEVAKDSNLSGCFAGPGAACSGNLTGDTVKFYGGTSADDGGCGCGSYYVEDTTCGAGYGAEKNGVKSPVYQHNGYYYFNVGPGSLLTTSVITAITSWAQIRNWGNNIAHDVAVKKAENTYMKSYVNIYGPSLMDDVKAAGALRKLGYSVEDTFDAAVSPSVDAVKGEILDQATDTSAADAIVDYYRTVTKTELQYEKDQAATFGQYQIDWRGEDPNFAHEVDLATAVVVARNTVYDILFEASSDLLDVFYDAEIAYNGSVSGAAKTMYQESQNASKEYGNSTKTATRTYEERYWSAYENAYQAAVDAAIADLEAELDYEIALYEQALQDYNDEYDGALDDMEDAINDLDNVGKPKPGVSPIENYDLGDWWNDNSLGIGTITLTKPLAQAEANNYGTLLEIDLDFYKGQIEEQAKAREIRADKDFSNKSNDFYNEYSSKLDAAYGNYLEKYKTLETECNTAIDEAESTYNTALDSAYEAYDEIYCNTIGRYRDAMKILDSGGTIEAEFFENGAISVDVQVCFAAGTLILMADGTTKPIEKIEIGDEVLARPHDNPTGPLRKCKVVRTFQNGPKETYKLTFDSGFTVQATPEHPFYVQNRGWVTVKDLQSGDVCVSADDKPQIIVDKELASELVPVYNFEVEGAHTYFVGKDDGNVLVHNECPSFLGDAWWFVKQYGRDYASFFKSNQASAGEAVRVQVEFTTDFYEDLADKSENPTVVAITYGLTNVTTNVGEGVAATIDVPNTYNAIRDDICIRNSTGCLYSKDLRQFSLL